MESSGKWLEAALLDLCQKTESGLDLDGDIISGLVSYCELASPLDAKEYLDNIIGPGAGQTIIDEYLRQRGYLDISETPPDDLNAKLHAYVKPSTNEGTVSGSKKQPKPPKESLPFKNAVSKASNQIKDAESIPKRDQGSSRKKKSGKVISFAELAKGSIVFQQGKPCDCQARKHSLVSNCLSCGKIVCEQEGEGPCSFCGALVLKEGSGYAGLEEGNIIPLSDAEAAAEAYAKRLVEYDRNSAARTTVIDDQSDYYQIEGSSWLSKEEKELLRKKKEEIEEAERASQSKLIMTFDLVGRKVLLNEDQVPQELQNRILLRPLDERETNRIKPNPTLVMKPTFVDPGPIRKNGKGSILNTQLCLEISGRVQHNTNDG